MRKSRFAEAGQFVPFDKELGYKVVGALKIVADRHGVSSARVALAWTLARPAISENLEDNIKAVALDSVSDPRTPYPKWMVLQLDAAEDPRPKVLYPERYAAGGPWKDLRGTKWSG